MNRIEQLKHNEDLLFSCIEYLVDLWSINEKDMIIDKFIKLGFTDDDIKYFNLIKEEN